MNVRACMTLNPVTIKTEGRVDEALDLMTTHGLRHLPVIDAEHRFVGVVRKENVRALLSQGGTEPPERGILAVTELGTPTLRPDDSAENAWALLSRSPGLNPVPVVTGNKLEGTVSQRDLLQAMASDAVEPAGE